MTFSFEWMDKEVLKRSRSAAHGGLHQPAGRLDKNTQASALTKISSPIDKPQVTIGAGSFARSVIIGHSESALLACQERDPSHPVAIASAVTGVPIGSYNHSFRNQ
ncbi:MAG: hypothetical protein NFW16_05475 [Candidatus Accumulibacter sp.]|uniref:hypothetical protein n=1 Tax=Accumulibacter sp. TaxID=2053492 RepID=UPI00258BD919|nr:hypothetical protein [Accumulibacter sp.]MCM8621188.1 hypothetical protein [Accumulibacter sp.]